MICAACRIAADTGTPHEACEGLLRAPTYCDCQNMPPPVLDLPVAVVSRGGVRGDAGGGWCAPAEHGVPQRAAEPGTNISGFSPG